MESMLKTILGILGNVIAIALFASPTPTFWRIFKKKTTGDFSGLPYVCTLLNCLLWVLYGLPLVSQHALLIITINVAGCAFEICYLTLFLAYAPKVPKRKVAKVLIACVSAFMVVVVLTLTVVPKNERKSEVGSMCVALAVAMYVSPLAVMRLVIRTRSVEFMPFLLSLFVFLNSAVWTGYGVVAHDIFVMIPNALGIFSGAAQLVLYAIYRNATPRTSLEHYDDKAGTGAGTVHMQAYPSAEKIPDGKPTYPFKGDKPAGTISSSQHAVPVSTADNNV